MEPHSSGETAPSSGVEAPEHDPQSSATQGSHEIQLRYKLAPTTFKTLCTIKPSPTRQDVLTKACFATEFRSFPIKQAERGFFRDINDNKPIPYHIKETVSQPWHKVFLLVQLDLSRAEWPNKLNAAARKELVQELGRMNNLLDKVLRCIVDILGERNDGRGINTALDVLRSVKARVWEGSELQLQQVEGIGPAKMAKLSQAGIKSIKQLSKLEFYHIERLLSRNPPFGQNLLHQLAGFPLLTLAIEPLGQYHPQSPPGTTTIQAIPQTANGPEQPRSANQIWIVRIVLGFQNERVPTWNKSSPWVTLVIEGDDKRLVWFWRGSVKRLMGGKEMVVGLHTRMGEILHVALACEEIVGTMLREDFQI